MPTLADKGYIGAGIGILVLTVTAPDYQRILLVLESEAGRQGMRCQQLATALGVEAVPAKAEGL